MQPYPGDLDRVPRETFSFLFVFFTFPFFPWLKGDVLTWLNINGGLEKGNTCSFMTATTNASSFSWAADSLAAVQAAALLFLPCNRRLHASPCGKLRFLQSHVDWGKLSFCSTPTSFVRVACCCFVSSAPRNTSTRNQFCSFFFKPFRLMFEIKRTASAVHSFFSLPLFPFPIQQCFTLLPPCGLEDPFELLSLVWCNAFILKNVPMCAQTWLHDHTGTDANYYFTIIIINMMEYNNHGFFFFLIIYIFNSFSQTQVEREVYLIWQFPR